MKSKIKDVKVIYPENAEEFNRKVAEVMAKIIIERMGENRIDVLIEKLKVQNKM